MAQLEAEQLFKLVYGAVIADVPNFGGHHGLHGMMRGLREELLKQTSVVCGKINTRSLSEKECNEYVALCQTAVSTDVLSENDLKTIVNIVNGSSNNG